MAESSCSILLVEDEPSIRDAICDILADEDYGVVCAENGREALNYLRDTTTRPTLILLDMYMPEMDGWAFRREQRADARLAGIPVIVVSAAPDLRNIEVDAVLMKPVHIDDLLGLVRRVIADAA